MADLRNMDNRVVVVSGDIKTLNNKFTEIIKLREKQEELKKGLAKSDTKFNTKITELSNQVMKLKMSNEDMVLEFKSL